MRFLQIKLFGFTPVLLFLAKQSLWAEPLISATASSSYQGRQPSQAVNQSGLKDGAHDNSLQTSWHSGIEQGNCWYRVNLNEVRPIRWMKLWNLNWAPYTDRGIKQADIYWSAESEPGNPVDNPSQWTLAVENQKFTRASHWADYGRNKDRRMPNIVDLGSIKARYICLKIDSNFTKTGQGYFGISELAFSDEPFEDVTPITDPLNEGPTLDLLSKPTTISNNQRFLAPKGAWDLKKYQFVEFNLHNSGSTPATVSCWIFSPDGWGGLGSCPVDSGVTFLEPGERAKVRIDLHARFLGENEENYCKVIDASKINYAEIVYQLRPKENASPIKVEGIKAIGVNRSKDHDQSQRLLVPEIEDGPPAPRKRVKKDRHVLYLPSDWKAGRKYPIIIEYPGNLFYNQFCYSPGLTEYGRLGWGLTKELGDPEIAGDGFIWLNLPFISPSDKEQISGWGSPKKTIDYCLSAIDDVVKNYGGDPDAVIFTGFSRGSLAANYIGLRAPEMAGLIRAWHRTPVRRAPSNKGGWHNMYAGHNHRIDHQYQGQMVFPRGVVKMGPRAHVDCGYLEDRPIALEGRKWLKDVLAPELAPLRNQKYNIWPQPDGSLHIANVEGGGFEIFRPEFAGIFSANKPVPKGVKWKHPVYNLAGWKIGEKTTADLFQLGEILKLVNPEIKRDGERIVWSFDHQHFHLEAIVTLPKGNAEPRIDYIASVKTGGYFTFAYTGAPSAKQKDIARLWQPLVWDGRRLPEQSFLIPDDHCSIPGCLVEKDKRTVGVMADPWQFPYEMPHSRNRKFGVALRNAQGEAQALVFSPFPGTNSRFKEGEKHQFRIQLLSRPTDLSTTFEYVATNICGFHDQRENTLTTLNETLENMSDYALGEWAKFDTKNKSSYYPDAKGTVKNVSCLHPLGIASVTDEPRFFDEQAVPIMEYLLSREKFLFAISEEGLGHGQSPSMNLNGPAMPVSELTALHRISRGNSRVFLKHAEQLYPEDRMLNMKWVTKGATWQRSLALYRATGEKKWLDDASTKADQYIRERVHTAPVEFSEAGDGTFFEYMTPWWKELYELYLETGNPEHLKAAHQGARRYAQFVWFYPSVPDEDLTVNPRGLSPRRGRPDDDGLIKTPKETVPAWQVSDQGLICEGNGTVQRLGILIATHAPIFLRIANDTGDDFLRSIARSAVIGRYANFPGYHLNTRFSTTTEKPDFPLHPYETLKPTTSMHYNHILPMVSLVIDYLISRTYDLSNGEIDFPSEFAEGYAYLQGRIYGSQPGRFYDESNIWPWMPHKLLTVDNRQVNYIAGRGENKICLAFTNTSGRPLEKISFKLNPACFQNMEKGTLVARVWRDNKPDLQTIDIKNGRGDITLSPKGITAICITGITPKVSFHLPKKKSEPVALKNNGAKTLANCHVDASILDFGPGKRWLYVFLRSKNGKPNLESVTLKTEFNDSAKQLTDQNFPFEFSVPLPDKTTKVDFSVTAISSEKTHD